jgi:hypothetical protein
MTEGWGTWEEDRRYVNADGTHLIVVSKRTQNYGGEEKTFWKTERRNSPSSAAPSACIARRLVRASGSVRVANGPETRMDAREP